jgi:hypothetical protein
VSLTFRSCIEEEVPEAGFEAVEWFERGGKRNARTARVWETEEWWGWRTGIERGAPFSEEESEEGGGEVEEGKAPKDDTSRILHTRAQKVDFLFYSIHPRSGGVSSIHWVAQEARPSLEGPRPETKSRAIDSGIYPRIIPFHESLPRDLWALKLATSLKKIIYLIHYKN